MPLFTMTTIKLIILICYFFVVIFVALVSWLYLSRTMRASKEIGLHAPGYIRILVRVSIINAIVTAVLIAIFLLTNFY
jgi:hypothetical protein